jgi:hypothetical protein
MLGIGKVSAIFGRLFRKVFKTLLEIDYTDIQEDIFMEHSEVHGDHWNALGFEDNEALEIIQESIEKGVLAQNYIFDFPDNKSKILPMLYPESNAVQICSLIVSKNSKNTAESFYPVLQGIKNKVIIDDKFTWKNKLEGEVEISRINQFNLSFFAPFYHQNFSNLKKGTKAEVYLSGLAFFAEKAVMQYEIEKGDMYEMALANFLRDNPQKTKRDFPFVTVRMDGATILFPTNQYSVYEYRGRIFDLEYVTFFGKKLAKTKVCLEKNDGENTLYINLYIAENNIRDCELKIGNDIQGVIWLMGYIK